MRRKNAPSAHLERDGNSKYSYIGKDNNSSMLAKNLEAAGDPKEDPLYCDVEDGFYHRYNAEAHHLICGNEVMAEEGELERFLIKQARMSSKGAKGHLEPNDVGYDINHANNGMWLPSVPDMFRKVGGREPERWWGDQKGWNKRNPAKPPRMSVEEWERLDAAFIVMQAVQRQFHKGPHGNVARPHQNYVKRALSLLRQLTVLTHHYAKECPMEEDGSTRSSPPYWPAHGLISRLDALSASLKRELEGPPETWNYYISEYAKECSEFWKKQMR